MELRRLQILEQVAEAAAAVVPEVVPVGKMVALAGLGAWLSSTQNEVN
jgi:hypothetical protein